MKMVYLKAQMELEKLLEVYIDAGELNKSIGIGFVTSRALWKAL